MKVRIDLRDLRFLQRAIPAMTVAAVRAAAESVHARSQQTVPVDTGRLKRSGAIEDAADGGALDVAYATPYAAYVEARVHFLEDAATAVDVDAVADAAATALRKRGER